MQIKTVSEDCVKILMESKDVNKFNMPFHKLHENDHETMEFIYCLLFMIYDETGISFLEDSLLVEAVAGYGGNYYILISRDSGEGAEIKLKKENSVENDMYIYSFQKLESLTAFAAAFEKYKKFEPTESALYSYAGKYYIVLNFSVEQTDDPDFIPFGWMLGEFFQKCRGTIENEGILCERGRLICPALLPLIRNSV